MRIRDIKSPTLSKLKEELTELKVQYIEAEDAIWVTITEFKFIMAEGLSVKHNISSHNFKEATNE